MTEHRFNADLVVATRLRLGMSRSDLAARAKVSHPHVFRIEQGTRNPSPSTAKKIADALDLDPLDLWSVAA